jgi:hypothetical protein
VCVSFLRITPLDRPLPESFFDQFVLAVKAMKGPVLGAGLLAQALGVVDQGLGQLLGNRHEGHASILEGVIDEPLLPT